MGPFSSLLKNIRDIETAEQHSAKAHRIRTYVCMLHPPSNVVNLDDVSTDTYYGFHGGADQGIQLSGICDESHGEGCGRGVQVELEFLRTFFRIGFRRRGSSTN